MTITTAPSITGKPEGFVPGPPGTHITIRHLNKAFAGAPLYQNFNLDIPRNKVTCIFGPNGCGKSKVMNMIAGLISMDSGSILFDGKSLGDTRIGYAFQDYREALFPWLRAIDNIKYPSRSMAAAVRNATNGPGI